MVLTLLLSLALAAPSPLDQRVASRDLDGLLALRLSSEALPELARALGQFRSREALERLTLLAEQQDTEVRAAALRALGVTPGAADVLRRLLDQELTRAPERALALRALGQIGAPEDASRLVFALAEAPRAAEQAALGLAHLARRHGQLDESAVAALARCVERPGRLSEAAGLALSESLATPLPETLRERIRRRWTRQFTSEAKAHWFDVALYGSTGTVRSTLMNEALRSTDRLLVIRAMRHVRAGELSETQLQDRATSEDAWVASEARKVLQRLGMLEARTADAPAITELERALEQLNHDGADAAGVLLTHEDPGVRELTATWLANHSSQPTPSLMRALVAALEAETSLPAAVALVNLVAGFPSEPVWIAPLARWSVALWPGVRVPAVRATVHHGGQPPATPDMDWPLPMQPDVLGARVMTSQGEVVLELWPDTAPLAVSAFVHLAEADTYDGLAWHRVVPGFVAQTGDTRGDGLGSQPWLLPDEIDFGPFDAGVVAMARTAPDTGSAQWFVTLSDQPLLQTYATRIGRVVSGLEVATCLGTGDVVQDVVIERRRP